MHVEFMMLGAWVTPAFWYFHWILEMGLGLQPRDTVCCILLWSKCFCSEVLLSPFIIWADFFSPQHSAYYSALTQLSLKMESQAVFYLMLSSCTRHIFKYLVPFCSSELVTLISLLLLVGGKVKLSSRSLI